MRLTFLTPFALLLAAAAVVPLTAFAFTMLRARRARSALRLPPPPRRSAVALALSLAAVPALIAVAAAQPVVEKTRTTHRRGDVEAWVVVDTSRSMLAAERRGAPTRFERAVDAALALRPAIREVPVGIASLTNRLLPHLFPTTDGGTYATTFERSIGIERPPPDRSRAAQITTFTPLAALATQNYFSGSARRRIAVVLTDGETDRLPPAGIARALAGPPRIQVLFVHIAGPGERVFGRGGLPEANYRFDPASGRKLRTLAELIGGESFEEDQLDAVRSALVSRVGEGPTVAEARQRSSLALAPYAVLACALPLAFVLRRRNL
jgi:hypothetical protein